MFEALYAYEASGKRHLCVAIVSALDAEAKKATLHLFTDPSHYSGSRFLVGVPVEEVEEVEDGSADALAALLSQVGGPASGKCWLVGQGRVMSKGTLEGLAAFAKEERARAFLTKALPEGVQLAQAEASPAKAASLDPSNPNNDAWDKQERKRVEDEKRAADEKALNDEIDRRVEARLQQARAQQAQTSAPADDSGKASGAGKDVQNLNDNPAT